MTKSESNKNKSTGEAVRDMKGEDVATEAQAVPNQFQVHPGNIPVLTVKLLDEMNRHLNRIATVLEAQANG